MNPVKTNSISNGEALTRPQHWSIHGDTLSRPRFASQPRFSLVNLASPANRKSTLLHADPLFCADQGASYE